MNETAIPLAPLGPFGATYVDASTDKVYISDGFRWLEMHEWVYRFVTAHPEYEKRHPIHRHWYDEEECDGPAPDTTMLPAEEMVTIAVTPVMRLAVRTLTQTFGLSEDALWATALAYGVAHCIQVGNRAEARDDGVDR